MKICWCVYMNSNRQGSNNLINGYSNRPTNNFSSNPILSNNPNLTQNSNIMSKISMLKMEQLKKAKSLKDVGLTDSELTLLVINPMQIPKVTEEQIKVLKNEYDNYEQTYESLKKYNEKNTSVAPKYIMDLWNNRKNTRYKPVLQIELKDKKYTKQDDLIIEKIDPLKKKAELTILEEELTLLKTIAEKYDKELKTIYCDEKQKDWGEQFEYANKHKNRIKYDPKDASGLKELYKKEQNKINKNKKRADDMLELMLSNNELTQEELIELEKLESNEDKSDDKIRELEEELEKELARAEQLESETKINIIENIVDIKEKYDTNTTERKKPIIIKKSIKKTDEEKHVLTIGTISQDELEKYKSRK
jgi:hypothetical protein